MLKLAPSSVERKNPRMLLQLKGLIGMLLISLVNEQKSQYRKNVQANFISEKVMTSLLKGDTNKDERSFPSGWIVVMQFMLTE